MCNGICKHKSELLTETAEYLFNQADTKAELDSLYDYMAGFLVSKYGHSLPVYELRYKIALKKHEKEDEMIMRGVK